MQVDDAPVSAKAIYSVMGIGDPEGPWTEGGGTNPGAQIAIWISGPIVGLYVMTRHGIIKISKIHRSVYNLLNREYIVRYKSDSSGPRILRA